MVKIHLEENSSCFLIDAAKLVESLSSQVMIASYTWNTTESYTSNRITNLIPKAEAARIFKDIPKQTIWFGLVYNGERYLSDVDKKDLRLLRKITIRKRLTKNTAKKNKYTEVVVTVSGWTRILCFFCWWSRKCKDLRWVTADWQPCNFWSSDEEKSGHQIFT